MKHASVAVAFFVFLLLASTGFAAEPLRLEILSLQEQQGRLTASVAIYGPDGLPVSTVPPGSVRATLDGSPLSVTGVQTNSTVRAPIAVVLVVDVSGSMAGDPITQARRALTDFVGSLEPGDQVALFAFDTNVRLLQDFTTDKAAAAQAVSRLTPLGDTALYDAVIEASGKATQAAPERKLVVLLTDGVATVNTTKRAASLDEARAAGASFVSIGLGADLDRSYLGDLASVSGGRFLEAPTPAALKQTYANLAAAIRTQFAVSLMVPETADRTLPAKLTISATINGASASAEKTVPPLAGAKPPPLSFNVTGIASGMKINTPVTLQPVIPAGAAGVTVEYSVDGQPAFKSAEPPYTYVLDPAAFEHGNHLVSVTVTDSRGRTGERQTGFQVVGTAGTGASPNIVLYLVPAVLLLAGGGYLLLRRQKMHSDGYSKRIKPWRGKIPDVAGPMARPPGEWTPLSPRTSALPADRALGRVIIMDEAAIRTGGLDAIREYEIGSNPLLVGTEPSCDIVIQDSEGRIGGEEARIWVQRGRLVYHKLTTLSAMATEGVTSGWQFLDSGEDIAVGPCRLAFELAAEPQQDAVEQPRRPEIWPERPEASGPPLPEVPELPRRPDIWPMRTDDAGPLGASSD